MKIRKTKLFAAVAALLFIGGCVASKEQTTIPAALIGNFEDDYQIQYRISEKLFLQEPGVKYHILKWNVKEKYIIAKNDEANPSEKGLYTRIDYMLFENMQPYEWGFCLTAYKAASTEEAERTAAADRANPRKGVGDFLFRG